ncbi:MAG TPA: S41 family peptidase [Arenibaculum sp.]|nr:S41 family peptidase [Arenibaculum sp.]
MRRTLLTATVSLIALTVSFVAQAASPAQASPAQAASPEAEAPAAEMPAARPAARPVDEPAEPGSLDPRSLRLLGQVLDRVRGGYVEEVPDEKLIEAAISGILTSLDPHSAYLDQKHFADMRTQTSGVFGGLGIEISMEEGLVKIVSPIDDTPAARAGLQAGDLITEIAGAPVLGMTMKDAVQKMRGEVGTEITIKVRRGRDKPFPLTLERAIVRSRAVRHEAVDNVGYIRITNFSRQTQPGLEKAITEIGSELGDGLTGYVLDLRNNPGGLLNQAVSVADSFLDAGTIVSTRGRGGVETQRFEARPGDLADGLPIVVLVNGGSASASEIVAGALQDHNRAVVLGTQSFGKGSVQTIMPLADGQQAIKMTTARYFTPSGRSIQAVGIAPDILVEQATLQPAEQVVMRKEADLPGALANGNAPPRPSPEAGPETTPEMKAKVTPAGEDADDKPFDYQRQRAVDLLTGMAAFGRPARAPQVVEKRQVSAGL